MTAHSGTWASRWEGPGGYREALAIGAPLMVSMGTFTLMQFTDRVFLGQHSVAEIAAAVPAGLASFTFLGFFMGVAGCVSTREAPTQGCRAEFLGTMRYHCACAPAFAARWFPQGLSLKAAWKAPAVVFNRDDTVHDQFLLQTLGASPDNAPRHHVPNSERFVDFVLGSTGYGLIPHLQAQTHLRAGTLLDLCPTPMPVPLYWHCWNIPSTLLARVGKALKAAAHRELA